MSTQTPGGSEAEKGAKVRFPAANLTLRCSTPSICAGRARLHPVYGPDEDRNRSRSIHAGGWPSMLHPVCGSDEDRKEGANPPCRMPAGGLALLAGFQNGSRSKRKLIVALRSVLGFPASRMSRSRRHDHRFSTRVSLAYAVASLTEWVDQSAGIDHEIARWSSAR